MALLSGLAAIIFVVLSATPIGGKSRSSVQFGALMLALIAAVIGTGLGMSL